MADACCRPIGRQQASGSGSSPKRTGQPRLCCFLMSIELVGLLGLGNAPIPSDFAGSFSSSLLPRDLVSSRRSTQSDRASNSNSIKPPSRPQTLPALRGSRSESRLRPLLTEFAFAHSLGLAPNYRVWAGSEEACVLVRSPQATHRISLRELYLELGALHFVDTFQELTLGRRPMGPNRVMEKPLTQ